MQRGSSPTGGSGLPTRGTIHASTTGGLLTAGTWSVQTLATYRFSGTASSFTMSTSRGSCGISSGQLTCGSGVSETTFSAVSHLPVNFGQSGLILPSRSLLVATCSSPFLVRRRSRATPLRAAQPRRQSSRAAATAGLTRSRSSRLEWHWRRTYLTMELWNVGTDVRWCTNRCLLVPVGVYYEMYNSGSDMGTTRTATNHGPLKLAELAQTPSPLEPF